MSQPVLRSLACALGAAAVAALFAGTVPASAASAASTRVIGGIDYAFQSGPDRMTVSGWAIDRAAPHSSISVTLRIDGVARRTVSTSVYRRAVNAKYHVGGRHGFHVTLSFNGGRKDGSVIRAGRHGSDLGSSRIEPMGARIVRRAGRYVGDPYREGGGSPKGFDCSGYAKYVYAGVDAGRLVHSAEGQRRQIRSISASALRPGDLIFYLSGGSAYHVAIYAGGGAGLYHGWQYAAATPREGVIHEHIWSRSIRFGTTWH